MRLTVIALAAGLALFPGLSGAHAQSDTEGGAGLDAPPATGASDDDPFADDSALPAASDSETAADDTIPPPPAPTAGYGTPVYPSPAGGVPGETVVDEGVRLPSNLATRLRVLDSSLQVLSARGGNRIVDGVLSLVSGGVSIGLGIWARHTGFRELARYAFLLGTVSVARGVLDLWLTPNPRTPAIQYAHMPMRTLDEARSRLEFGESALEELARRTRMVRLIDASLSIVSGVAVVPIFLHAKDYKFTEPLDYFIVVAAGISVITGVINLLTRSDAERRWSAYEDLRDRLDDEEAAGTVVDNRGPELLGLGIAPVPGGATAGAVIGF